MGDGEMGGGEMGERNLFLFMWKGNYEKADYQEEIQQALTIIDRFLETELLSKIMYNKNHVLK